MLRDDCYAPNKIAVSSNYVSAGLYAGMFGTRGTCVEFTDVVLTITGESQGA